MRQKTLFEHNTETVIIVQGIHEISLDTKAETATIPEPIKILITLMDICKISENSNMKTGRTLESMDICKISENSNMKTATTPESEEISEISLNAF